MVDWLAGWLGGMVWMAWVWYAATHKARHKIQFCKEAAHWHAGRKRHHRRHHCQLFGSLPSNWRIGGFKVRAMPASQPASPTQGLSV